MSDFTHDTSRSLEMGVYVTKPDGRKYGVVAEEQLEAYGWGLDPAGAVERYRAALNIPGDVKLRVCSDEESHYPSFVFDFQAGMQIRSTRPQRVFRALARYFDGLANTLATSETPPDAPEGSVGGKFELHRLVETEQEN